MKEKLESELKKIAQNILKMKGSEDLTILQTEARTIYEKLTLLKFVKAHFSENQTVPGKDEGLKKFEELASNVIFENTQVPENNPHQEDLINNPAMMTIKDIVSEMPKEETLNDILASVQPDPTFIKKEENKTPSSTITNEPDSDPKKRSLNDIFKKEIQIGLNDRIGFVNNLFNSDNEAFKHALSRLNTMKTKAEAMHFINNEIKPAYNNWEGKEDYETRFSELIEARFEA